ncbi:DNA breaking-rejoining enzyme [Boletus edulis]|nr:DNA breaking-rejoining enzyme [Boletus edulis]
MATCPLGGGYKSPTQIRCSFSNAQKMRAAATYGFGRLCGLGSTPWQTDNHGHCMGNPSISPQVSNYMCSLRRRKAQAGEDSCSARAITPVGDQSGGVVQTGLLLHSVYTLAFICLLRVDEVLNIQAHHIQHDCLPGEQPRMVLTLPFRKTHQYGGIEPFVLYPLHEKEIHLCPVRAYAKWVKHSGINSGYIFRRITHGRLHVEKPLIAAEFLELFRLNLCDIRINPDPYGTHSFRRGGCQYLHLERRWPIRLICEWGGWSKEFTNLTIVKYLISSSDASTVRREHFFKPDLRPATHCPHCGRTCPCA